MVAAAAVSLAEVMAMRQQDILGRLGARAAAGYLERAGVRILDRIRRWAAGGIGIVAAGRRVLVPCGVKAQPCVRHATPVEAVTSQKLRRLRGPTLDGLRVDIVGVLRSPSGDFTIEHLRGVG
jgi:putative endonuclease